jgi:uncharacterized protein (DUF1800 family)
MRRSISSKSRRKTYARIAKRHGIVGRLRFQRPFDRDDEVGLESNALFGHPGNDQNGVQSSSPSAQAAPSDSGVRRSNSSPSRLVTLAPPPFAVRILNHMTFGVTPESLAAFNALGSNDTARLTAFVDQQLNPSTIDDSAVDARLTNAGYITLGKSLTQLWTEHRLSSDGAISGRPGRETSRAALMRAVHSRRQVFEVLTDFWHNHFNVHLGNSSASPVYVHHSRDVIRANALGNFRTMLEAVAKSPAMLYYLNNASNTRSGPNENYARELLELHTFGAENYLGFVDPFQVPPCPEDTRFPIGYTDLDVYDTAAAFTGWTVRDGRYGFPNENDGNFVYRPSLHDAGPKLVLGRYIYPEQPALKDGRDIFDRIAQHPRVAKFICKKLIRRFISDHPDPALIDSAAAVFRDNWQQPDQLKRTLRHILLSDAQVHSYGWKWRRPFELVVAALRNSGSDWTLKPDDSRSNDFMSRLSATGHSPYDWPAPNGYPDSAVSWSGSNNLVTTWRMLAWLTETTDNAVPLLPILALSRSNVPSWTAVNLVDFWLRQLLGYVPNSPRRQLLINFMAQNGNPTSYVIEDTDVQTSSDMKRHYNQQRLRTMVSLILTSPEFISR